MATAAWPVYREEPRAWSPPADATPRALAVARSGTYRQAIAPRIARCDVVLRAPVAAAADEAIAAITRLDAELSGRLGAPVLAVLARSEASSSSRIEYIEADAAGAAAAVVGLPAGEDARATARNVEVLLRAMAAPWPPTPAAIGDLRAVLLAENPPRGTFRDRPVWIGQPGSLPPTAQYVAPEAHEVPALMDDWIAFVSRVDVPALAHAAIAHAQFESIHPFGDGNGRTGRALVHPMLRAAGVLATAAVPLSAGLISHQDAYVAALISYRQGHVNPIVEVFAEASLGAVALTRGLVERLDAVREAWRGVVVARADAGVWKVADALIQQPVVDAGALATLTGLTPVAVYRAVAAAEAAGVVTQRTPGKRNQIWHATAVLDVLDGLAVAARRGRW